MAITLAEIRDKIRIDAGIQGDNNFTDTRLNRIANESQLYVQVKLNGLGINEWTAKSDELTTTASDITAGTYAGQNVALIDLDSSGGTELPITDMLRHPSAIESIEVSDGSNSGIAEPVERKRFKEQLNNSYMSPTVADQPVFMLWDRDIYLAPSTITSAHIYYYKRVATLSADADETEIPVEFEHYIVNKAVIAIKSILGDLQDRELRERELDNDLTDAYTRFVGSENEKDRYERKIDSQKLQ